MLGTLFKEKDRKGRRVQGRALEAVPWRNLRLKGIYIL